MKRKLILSIFAALLVVAMLLPLTSCGLIEKAEEGGTTEISTDNAIPTESPTEAQTDPSPTPSAEITNATTEPQPPVVTTDPIRGAWIPHTEAMLALKEKVENSNEEWTKIFWETFFWEVYENDLIRRGMQYRIAVWFHTETNNENLEERAALFRAVGIEKDDFYYLSIVDYWICYATAEQIEALVRGNSNIIRRVYTDGAHYNE